jgi:hypothetical protein
MGWNLTQEDIDRLCNDADPSEEEWKVLQAARQTRLSKLSYGPDFVG